MKLYTKPGACSTAVHIALQWSGQPYEYEILRDYAALKSPAFLAINPAGAVPAVVDGDYVLTQNAAIMGYVADRQPAAGLAGDGSPRQRAEATRWLAFVNSDVHPAYVPLFAPSAFHGDADQHDGVREAARKRLRGLYGRANKQLEARDWLAGFRSFADPYLYVTLGWAERTGVDLSGLERLQAFKARMDQDPGVQATLKAEGLAA